MKYVSLFAGIGGFDLALNRLGHECVYVSEWDKYATQTYEKNFHNRKHAETRTSNGGTEPNIGASNGHGRRTRTYDISRGVDTRSITDVPADSIPDHDLLVGGFPCQAFSIAGKRRGFNETRGTLFFDIARILKEKQPRYFILENVKGLLSHDSGRTFKTIITTLVELGYDVQWQVLNSKNFGVPQNRERVFIVGHLRGQPRPQVFPIGESNSGDIESQQDDSRTSRTISARFRKGVGNTESRIIDVLVDVAQGQRIRNIEGLPQTLSGLGGGQGAKTGLYAVPVLTPDRPVKRQNGRRFKEDGEPAFTLTGQDKHGIFNGKSIRRLTPIECERLQGFPDNWTEGVSDTQRYKQLGNAVTVNVVYEVARRLNQ